MVTTDATCSQLTNMLVKLMMSTILLSFWNRLLRRQDNWKSHQMPWWTTVNKRFWTKIQDSISWTKEEPNTTRIWSKRTRVQLWIVAVVSTGRLDKHLIKRPWASTETTTKPSTLCLITKREPFSTTWALSLLRLAPLRKMREDSSTTLQYQRQNQRLPWTYWDLPLITTVRFLIK